MKLETVPESVAQESVEAILTEIRNVGFVVVEGLMPPEQADALRGELEILIHREPGNRLASGHQRALHLAVKNPIFLEPLCHPLVLAVWRRYLGEDVICSSLSSNTLWPGCTELYWHVDHPHWTIREPYPTFPLASQSIWMLDDFTEANGATAGIPGSHHRDHLPTLGDRWPKDAALLTGRKGSVIMADGAWWHTSRPNRTDKPRSALLIKYIRSFCIPQEDMRRQLAQLEAPSETVKHLFGGNQYQPRPDFPY